MSAAKQGKVGRVRAHGVGPEGLPADVLSILNDLAGRPRLRQVAPTAGPPGGMCQLIRHSPYELVTGSC